VEVQTNYWINPEARELAPQQTLPYSCEFVLFVGVLTSGILTGPCRAFILVGLVAARKISNIFG
jgi:hypothetical protein